MTSIQNHQAKEHLIAVLQERGVQLGSDDVAWAFSSPKTRDEIIAWVKEYLGDETLLTADEVQLFQELSAKRGVPSGIHLDTSLAVYDGQLKSAIESLQASTAMIDHHTKALEKQWEALQSLRQQAADRRNGQQSPSRSRNENGQMDHAIEDMTQSLEEEFSIACKHSSRATSSLSSLVSERLSADDQVLAALSNLAPRTMPQPKETVTIDIVEKWAKLLAALREQEANAKIDKLVNDTIYDSIDTAHRNRGRGESHSEDLNAELVTLRGEIGSVMELVVGSEFRQPLVRLLKSSKIHSQSSQHEWLHYVLATMEHMINQLDAIVLSAADIQSYNHTLSEIRMVLVSIYNPQASSEASQSRPRGQTDASSRPGHVRRGDSRSAIPYVNLADQVFRRFSVTGRVDGEVLEAAATSGASKLHSQYASATSSTIEIVGKSLEEQRRELQSVLKQLYAFSEYSSVELLPKSLEASVQNLDYAIANTVSTLSAVESGNHDSVRRGIARLHERLEN